MCVDGTGVSPSEGHRQCGGLNCLILIREMTLVLQSTNRMSLGLIRPWVLPQHQHKGWQKPKSKPKFPHYWINQFSIKKIDECSKISKFFKYQLSTLQFWTTVIWRKIDIQLQWFDGKINVQLRAAAVIWQKISVKFWCFTIQVYLTKNVAFLINFCLIWMIWQWQKGQTLEKKARQVLYSELI